MKNELKIPAMRVRQTGGRPIYLFGVDGKLVPSFAAISRIRREDGQVLGYQRPEVVKHIQGIREYLESDQALLPNPVVIAFDDRVRFDVATGALENADSAPGLLVIPLDEEARPGFVVDGQQRLAAIREARVEKFPVCVSAFIARTEAEETKQFILVNSAKPLDKSLIHELLPGASAGELPEKLERKRLPALLLERLNGDKDSPLFEMIATTTCPKGMVKDNTVLKVLENSLSDGVLYALREKTREEQLRPVKAFFWAVKSTFQGAFGLPPRKSRLMHGAGFVAMGLIMDAIATRAQAKGAALTEQVFAEHLRTIAPLCRWTEGTWEFGVRWNELQNTSQDIGRLCNYLTRAYLAKIEGTR